MGVLLLFLTVVTVLQVGILAFCFLHRRDPLRFLPRERRAEVLIALLQTRNAVRGIGLYASALLRAQYGKLTIAQIEFLHQISSSVHQAQRRLDDLTDSGGPLAEKDAEGNAHQESIDRERTFHPPSHSILSYLQCQESGRIPKQEP